MGRPPKVAVQVLLGQAAADGRNIDLKSRSVRSRDGHTGARPIGDFVTRHPTMKVLALAFLVLIGVMLVAEGIGTKIPKGYVYFAMAFALGVELVNLRVRRRAASKA